MAWLLAHLRPRPTTPPRGPAIQHAEQHAAQQRLLDLARRRRAARLHDGPTFGPLP